MRAAKVYAGPLAATTRIALIASVFATLAFAGAASAQGRLSLSAGAAPSRLSGEDAARFGVDNQITGFYIGLAGDIPILSDKLRFGPGARYLSRGYELEADSSTTKLNYLELIAPLIVEIPLVGGVKLNLSGGPGFALSMGCKILTRTEDTERSLDCQNDQLLYRNWDVTAFGAGGLAYGIPNGATLLLNAGLDVSLRSIDSSGSDIDFRNRSLLIGAQVTFPLGPRRR